MPYLYPWTYINSKKEIEESKNNTDIAANSTLRELREETEIDIIKQNYKEQLEKNNKL